MPVHCTNAVSESSARFFVREPFSPPIHHPLFRREFRIFFDSEGIFKECVPPWIIACPAYDHSFLRRNPGALDMALPCLG